MIDTWFITINDLIADIIAHNLCCWFLGCVKHDPLFIRKVVKVMLMRCLCVFYIGLHPHVLSLYFLFYHVKNSKNALATMFVPVPFRFWKNRNDFTCISLGHYITSFMVGSHAGLLNRTYYRCLSLSGFLAVGRTAIRANSNKGPVLMCRGIFFENEHGWPLGRLSAANGVCRNSNRTGKSMKSTKAELSFDRMALFYHVCIGIISSTICPQQYSVSPSVFIQHALYSFSLQESKIKSKSWIHVTHFRTFVYVNLRLQRNV